MILKKIFTSTIFFIITNHASGNESIPIPDPLQLSSGQKVSSTTIWEQTRRPELLELFKEHVYGHNPVDRPQDLQFKITKTDKQAMNGKATLKQVQVSFSGPGGKGNMNLVIFIPNHRIKPAPGFVLILHRSAEENYDPTRTKKTSIWPAELLIERGYAAIGYAAEDIDLNKKNGFDNGVHKIYDPQNQERPANAWGTIAAWSWGASRVMDYLETDPDIDSSKIGVAGHSRSGKAALWCGATDARFAYVISNDSGCTGAAISRNKSGESIAKINKSFPHWFCDNYKKFNDNEAALPVDQHELVALIAPRLVYIASASKDKWADPKNEFLAAVHASPVYELYGLKGVGATTMPKEQSPLHEGHIGHHIRTGKHDLVEYDWNCFMDFSDKHWK